MRITVEIGDADRAKLLELAERRGEKGFSRIVSEAIALYLRQVPDNDEKRRKAAKTKGTLSKVLQMMVAARDQSGQPIFEILAGAKQRQAVQHLFGPASRRCFWTPPRPTRGRSKRTGSVGMAAARLSTSRLS